MAASTARAEMSAATLAAEGTLMSFESTEPISMR